MSVSVVQVDFSQIAENGSADFNVVAKLDLTPLKSNMNDFPYKYFKKYIPDSFYVSSTVRVDKTEATGFDYTIVHKSLTLNNLSADDTADLFDTLNAVLKIGTAESLNMQIGYMAVNGKKLSKLQVSCAVSGFMAAILNTIFFMTLLVVLFGNSDYMKTNMAGRNPLLYIVVSVGINALFEMVVSTLLTTFIGGALFKARLIATPENLKE